MNILIDDTKGESRQLSVLPDFGSGSLRTRKSKLVFNCKNGSPTDPLSHLLENLPRADLSKAAWIRRAKLRQDLVSSKLTKTSRIIYAQYTKLTMGTLLSTSLSVKKWAPLFVTTP